MKAGAATCLTSVLLNWYWMSKKWWTGCKIQCSTSRYTLQKIVNAHLSCYNTSVFIAIPHELLKSTFSENPLSFAESKQTLLHLSHHQQRLSQIQFLLQAAGEGLAHDVQAASQVPPQRKVNMRRRQQSARRVGWFQVSHPEEFPPHSYMKTNGIYSHGLVE